MIFSLTSKSSKRRRELQERKRLKEMESRLHPKNNKDFETLYNGLESKINDVYQRLEDSGD